MTWESLPDHARVWVYTADRQLDDAEVADLTARLRAFTERWTAHRRELAAHGEVRHGRFVILAVDERQAGASGCSIDASVRFLQGCGRDLGVDFFDRMTFFADNGAGYLPYPRDKFAEAYRRGELDDTSPVIDPLVKTKAELDAAFVKPLAESWHARMV